MDLRPLILLAFVFVSADAWSQAYRWVDEDGVVHYSDRYQPGAEQIVLPESNSIQMRSPQMRTRDSGDDEQQATQNPYRNLSIASPSAEETLWNIGATLDVSLSLTPALRPGHQVRVYFDGEPQLFRTTRFQLNEVYRGAHNLQAEILDASGEMLIRSESVRFYVQQNSVITPPGAAPGVAGPQGSP